MSEASAFPAAARRSPSRARKPPARRFFPWPWLDRAGKLSPLKLAVFLAIFGPGLWNLAAYALDDLGARPLDAFIHAMGLWAIRLLFLSLAVTPLRQAWDWPRLIQLRRMLGVAAFAYAAIHLLAYADDQAFSVGKIVSEIVRRFYLTLGFTALCGLAALAATSTDGMVRRLGGRAWARLHRLVYPIAIVATVHAFLQAKLNVTEPFVMAGCLSWLLAYRGLTHWRGAAPGWAALAFLGFAAASLTAAVETLYVALKFGAPPWRVLAANLSAAAGTRPAWIVLLAAAVVMLGSAASALLQQRPLEARAAAR